MSENILEVKGLTKDYGDFVLDKLTFTVPKRSEAVLQWGKRKNIKKSMINGKLVIE